MRPTLGRVVIYTRDFGDEYAATITRVTPRDAATDLTVEGGFDVFLAVDVHRDGSVLGVRPPTFVGNRWYSPSPVNYSETPMAYTWRWPPRV